MIVEISLWRVTHGIDFDITNKKVEILDTERRERLRKKAEEDLELENEIMNSFDDAIKEP